jgi:fucose permease
VNVEGADIEARLGRSTLPTIHGFFSLGTLVGAVAGIAMTAWAVPVVLHLGVVAVLEVGAVLFAFRRIPMDVGRHAPTPHEHAAPHRGVWRDPLLVLIGVVILSLALAEGSANDWLPLVMVDGHGLTPAEGSATFTGFALAMTLGRLLGGRAVDRIGAPAALGISAAVSALGIAGVTLIDSVPVAVTAAAVWGLGAALGFPVALSLAAKSGPRAQARMSFAVTMGYTAFLVGPPVLGVLGDHVGLRGALLVVLGLALIAVLSAVGIARLLRGRVELPAAPQPDPDVQPSAERWREVS